MLPIELPGPWELRRDGDTAWRPVAVPGCWEAQGAPLDDAGPFWYRTRFAVPAEWANLRIWLRFHGVSYHCAVFANGQEIGEHTGLWDSFEMEIGGAVTAGAECELLLRAEKPASLTAGPDSPSAPGRFRLRETLAGFLPYVWGHMFGGVWQPVELFATGAARWDDVLVRGAADGTVEITAATSANGAVQISIFDPELREVWRGEASTPLDTRVQLPAPRPWSPETPALYTARLALADGDERTVPFGLRSLRAEGSRLLLNDAPIYPRMALSWGWYPEALHSNPGPERVRADFARLRALGYNGVKLCLWFPPQYYFDLADELGMLLWVELPMWIPQPSPFFRAQVPVEYDRLMRQARQHPSVILYTLGCELSRVVDAQMLAPLFALVKGHAGSALVRDNSGSGEAYGGLLNEFAEFYDYHFYSDLHHFRPLLDYFAPRGRPPQPWLFGEYCDYDTFRDPNALTKGVLPYAQTKNQKPGTAEPGNEDQEPGTAEPGTENRVLSRPEAVSKGESMAHATPWWASHDPAVNLQGARWQYDLPEQPARLRANGMDAHAAELERISAAQGLWHRKYTIEQTRLFHEIGGYVVTGEADTPISTAGMWDARDQLKFAPDAFRAFNGDTVLLAGWDRRREWVAGGDRAAPWDQWSYPAGTAVRAHLILSHYGAARGPAQLRWDVAFAGSAPFAQGTHETAFALAPGDLRELAVAEFATPYLNAPRQATLSAEVAIGDTVARNSWPLWVFPREPWRSTGATALHDPAGRLRDFGRIAPGIGGAWQEGAPNSTAPAFSHLPTGTLLISTAWDGGVREWIARGGRAIVLLGGDGVAAPLPVRALPFWREAIRLAAPHPAWGDFPRDDALAMQLFGCAADCALDMAGYSGAWQPILRRLDARTMLMHEYAVEVAIGAGRAIVSTLRFEGGQGAQPLGVARNTAAAYLLWCWARWLAGQ